MHYFLSRYFWPHFKVNTFCPTITFFMAIAWAITWRCISIGKSVITIFSTYLMSGWLISLKSSSFGISFEYAVQLPFTVLLYSTVPDNYAFLSLSPSQL